MERVKAEATAGLAIEALDRMFERFSPTKLRAVPQTSTAGDQTEAIALTRSPILSREAAALLEEMLPFYDRLAQKTGDSDQLRLETAKANQRVGAIRQRLGQSDEAVQAYRRAIALYDQLRTASPTSADSAASDSFRGSLRCTSSSSSDAERPRKIRYPSTSNSRKLGS